MKANELRINNLLFYKVNKEVIKVQALELNPTNIRGYCILFSDENGGGIGQAFLNESFDPIPLTEEWLEKFGLKKSLLNEFEIEGRLCLSRGEKGFYLSVESEWGSWDQKFEIEYVHQLQNLFFAIRGEELTIKKLTA